MHLETVILLSLICSSNTKILSDTHLVKKTAISYPWDLESTCSIGKIEMKVANRYTCLPPCVDLIGCTMYCISYQKCHYYNAWVSPHYLGTGAAPAYSECYTFRHSSRDITHTIESIATTADVVDSFVPELAINGYFCDHFLACFLGDYTSENKDLMMDLGATRNVSTIEIIVASILMWSSPNTGDVRITLGDDSTYSSNPEFAYFPGLVPRYLEVPISTTSPPMTGRYLKMSGENSGAFYGICDIRILS